MIKPTSKLGERIMQLIAAYTNFKDPLGPGVAIQRKGAVRDFFVQRGSVSFEVHDKREAEIALKYQDALIGINNRNLKTLEISINNTISIFEIVKNHKGPLISESGIKNENDAKYIYEKTGIKNFLIGESLLNSGNPGGLMKKIIQINQ